MFLTGIKYLSSTRKEFVMIKKLLFVAVALFAISNVADAAEVGCNIGWYSKDVNGNGGVATNPSGTWKEPAVQGGCRWTSEREFYVDGWVSQSTKHPGLGDTFANEIDVTLGITKKINALWSYDLHFAYYDIANEKLLQLNGDIVNPGGTLWYQATPNLKLSGNIERYDGIGSHGFKGGWRLAVGTATTLGPVSASATLFNNVNFLGHGRYAKIALEPINPMMKIGTAEIRPVLHIWRTFGKYNDLNPNQVVVGIRANF
ncbi:MAG: hypothetical protein NUV60_02590 [Patescibacteria group bacterium]|nr:hypothetical protein [Patescibacteria group bacterium]